MTAQFGDRGLTALAGPETGQSARFVRDDFAVAIGDRTYASRELPPPTRVALKDRVTYTWAAAPYRVIVVYELAQGWRFISKQVSIEGGAAPYRVSEVVVFDSNVADPIAGDFIPKSARTNLGTGDYGACLRFDRGAACSSSRRIRSSNSAAMRRPSRSATGPTSTGTRPTARSWPTGACSRSTP